jgi:hypothetical protein
MKQPEERTRKFLLPWLLLAFSAPLGAQETGDAASSSDDTVVSSQVVSPEARAVLDRMTAYLRSLTSFSIDTHASRDEAVALGYKLQNNERSQIIVQRPNRLRAEVSGDIRNRTFVYDGKTLTMYSPEDDAYVKIEAPDNIGTMVGMLLDAGVEMPLIDVLYQATAGTLTDFVRGGILVGTSTIDGVECDQLAFRQASIDWQLWVERGTRPLPRRILITTRYEVGDPQYEATLHWNLKPRIHASTFAFAPPKGAIEIPLDTASTGIADSTP